MAKKKSAPPKSTHQTQTRISQGRVTKRNPVTVSGRRQSARISAKVSSISDFPVASVPDLPVASESDLPFAPLLTCPFPFLDLPGEIRNTVYRLLIERAIGPVMGKTNGQWRKILYKRRTISVKEVFQEVKGLLNSSRVIRNEAGGLFEGSYLEKVIQNLGLPIVLVAEFKEIRSGRVQWTKNWMDQYLPVGVRKTSAESYVPDNKDRASTPLWSTEKSRPVRKTLNPSSNYIRRMEQKGFGGNRELRKLAQPSVQSSLSNT